MMTIDFSEGLTPYLERILDAAGDVAPDLQGPVYIIGRELPRMRGLSIAGLDRVFEREIRLAGKWHGRGPAVAVDEGGVYGQAFAAARSEGLDERQSDRFARLELAGVALHELALAIATGSDGTAGILADGLGLARAGFEAYLRDDPLPGRFKTTPPVAPWHGHDLRFIRAAAVLHSRLRDALPLELSDIVPPGVYGLAEPRYYQAAMETDGDFSFATCTPIRAIIARPAGPVLTARWRQDVFAWYKNLPQATDAHTQAALEALALCSGRQAKAEAVPVAAATDDWLPQPFEHFYELRQPEDFLHDSFRSKTVADGIRRMAAKLRDDPDGSLQPAAFYFDCNLFTWPEATGWMNEHGFTFTHSTPAKDSTYPQLTS